MNIRPSLNRSTIPIRFEAKRNEGIHRAPSELYGIYGEDPQGELLKIYTSDLRIPPLPEGKAFQTIESAKKAAQKLFEQGVDDSLVLYQTGPSGYMLGVQNTSNAPTGLIFIGYIHCSVDGTPRISATVVEPSYL